MTITSSLPLLLLLLSLLVCSFYAQFLPSVNLINVSTLPKGSWNSEELIEDWQSSRESIVTDPKLVPTLSHRVPDASARAYVSELIDIVKAKQNKEIMPVRPMVLRLDLLLTKVKDTVEKDGIFESVVALFMACPKIFFLHC